LRISLCLLTFNEIDGCRHDVPLISRDAFDEIYAVDGGSVDGTPEYLSDQDIPVYRQPVKSLNAACCYGIEKCSTDAVIFFHPKGTVPVSDCEKFRALFEGGYEVIVASRNMAGGYNEEDCKLFRPRKWLSFGMAALAALLWKREGNVIWDIPHGFRGATVSAFKQIDLLPVGVSVDLEMVVRSYRYRLKRVEFPTQERARLAGGTHFGIASTGPMLLRYLIFELFTRGSVGRGE